MSFTDKFAALTELNIACTTISAQGLNHIVSVAPKLKKLCTYLNINYKTFANRIRVKKENKILPDLVVRNYSI